MHDPLGMEVLKPQQNIVNYFFDLVLLFEIWVLELGEEFLAREDFGYEVHGIFGLMNFVEGHVVLGGADRFHDVDLFV